MAHPTMRVLTSELLRHEGDCRVRVVTGHDQALAVALDQELPDLVVVDTARFPGCCPEALRRFPPGRMIVIGPEPGDPYRVTALAAGAGGWVARERVGEDLMAEVWRVFRVERNSCSPSPDPAAEVKPTSVVDRNPPPRRARMAAAAAPATLTSRPLAGGNMSEHATTTQEPVQGVVTAGVSLEATGITKSYRRGVWPRRREVVVLRGAELSVGAGEVVGLVGENGSGKSTLMKILVGALAADGGRVKVSGRIGYCPQEPLLYDRLTCDEHLELFGVAYGMEPAAVLVAADDLYATLGFARWRAERVEELSGGTRAKLNLALALLADPEVLLLDEPYAGFDWDTYLRFWDLTAQRRSAGRSVVVISHFVTDEERFDRIVELRDGRTVQR